MPRKPQEFTVNIHIPENPEDFKYIYTNFLCGIALKTMKRMSPKEQQAYAEKYIKFFCP